MDNRDSIIFDSIQVRGGDASITLTVPVSLVPVLKSVLESLFSLATSIDARRRFAVAGTSPDFKERCDAHYKGLVSKALREFNKHYTPGNFRQAVNSTKKALVSSGYVVTCGMIEEIVKQERKLNGRR